MNTDKEKYWKVTTQYHAWEEDSIDVVQAISEAKAVRIVMGDHYDDSRYHVAVVDIEQIEPFGLTSEQVGDGIEWWSGDEIWIDTGPCNYFRKSYLWRTNFGWKKE